MSVGLLNRNEKVDYVLFDKRAVSSSEMHYRSDYELIFNVRGRRTLQIGDNSRVLEEGDIAAIGPYVPSLLRMDDDPCIEDCFSIVFRTSALGREFINSRSFNQIRAFLSRTGYGQIFHGEKNKSVFKSAEHLRNTSCFGEVIYLFDVLNQLALADHYKAVSTDRCHTPTINRNRQLVSAICSYVDDHYHESLYVESVAQNFCMARSTFTRFFKSNAGMPFIKHLNQVRIRHACEMLEKTREPIANIAINVGYSSLSNFNNQFRLVMSVSPSRYRKQRTIAA